ncbi:MAG: phosphodiester glycosidase family protein [bacterium]|nr:phosphodiester glycosidase family protein [bacterium]
MTAVIAGTGILFADLPEILTTRIRKVGPGLVQKTLEAPSRPWLIHVLEADLTNPYIHIVNADGGTLQPPSQATRAREKENYRLAAAVNGDFFYADGKTVNANVMDGEIIRLENYSSDPRAYWPALSINSENKLNISCNVFEGTAVFSDTALHISQVNENPAAFSLGLINSHGGAFSLLPGMSAVRFVPLSEWALNAPVYGMMDSLALDSAILMPAPGKAFLTAGEGLGNILAEHYQKGRLVKLELSMLQFEDLSDSSVSFDPLPQLQRIRHVIGGYPTIVREGQNYALEGFANENGTNRFAIDRHPRTAVAFNRDTTRMYLVVVDGRQSHSIGIDLPDLADILIQLGAWRGMNFDGGGSSVFLTADAIANLPSDGRERAVRNSCAIYSSAPEGNMALLQIERDSLALYLGESAPFSVSAWDAHYHYREIPDSASIDIYCDPELGSVSVINGKLYFTANGKAGQGYVYAVMADSLRPDSMFVRVRGFGPLFLTPGSVISDTRQAVDFTVHGVSEEGDTLLLPNRVLRFSLADSSIGSIDNSGRFLGKKKGSSRILAEYGDVSATAEVKVFAREGEFVLDPVKSLDGWDLIDESREGLSARMNLVSRRDTDKAVRIDYSSLNGGCIEAKKTIPLPGIPEMLLLEFRGDGRDYRISAVLEDANGKQRELGSDCILNFTDYRNVFLDISSLDAAFPLKLRKLCFHIPGGQAQGTLFWDNLKVAYPSDTQIEYRPYDADATPVFRFEPVYPEYSVPLFRMDLEVPEPTQLSLEIFTMRGERIGLLLNKELDPGHYRISWQSPGLPCGLYLYRLKYGEQLFRGKVPLF